jgi:hypothetical protein
MDDEYRRAYVERPEDYEMPMSESHSTQLLLSVLAFQAGPNGNSQANTCRMTGDVPSSIAALMALSVCTCGHCSKSAS